MELYLDTNIIYQYFVNLVQHRPQPKIFNYLYNVKHKHDYFVSNLTKAEVFRKLHSEHDISTKECHQLWNYFKKAIDITELEVTEIDFEEISIMVSQRPSKRGMLINIIHLMIAKRNNLTVLTGDKPLKERFQVFYPKVMNYEEFRKV